MMGNFSFGDYFKKEAIHFAWDFLVKELNLPVENLHATVFTTDDQAYDIWHQEIGIPKERIHRLGAKDNFWQMGDVGPCGPCTEIHLDRGAEFGCKDIATCGPACDCDRFLEIWNLVFMQFDRGADGVDKPLKQTGVDTGMGLERLCAVVQDKDSVFLTDLFEPIIERIEQLTNKKYAAQTPDLKAAFHVLADHARSSTMIIADGGAPSNEGRGYVLRKIIRRAALFAQKLTDQNIFPELSRTVVEQMAPFYPELKLQRELVYQILESEIKKFSANLVRGQALLEKYVKENGTNKVISGEQAFKLYDTFGFPLEITQVIAHEKGLTVDVEGFGKHMTHQQEQSQKQHTSDLDTLELDEKISSEFTGYQELETSSKIIGLVHNGALVERVPAGQTCFVIAARSPFFIVGGGQLPDHGWLTLDGHKTALISVRYLGKAIAAQVETPVDLAIGSSVISTVDKTWRTNAMKNHTATHLLQAALITLFGKNIKQSGSVVHPDYLRFDFTYHENLGTEDIAKVEDLVNAKICENVPVSVEYMNMKDAVKKGALAFFGDKYNPEKVRVIDVPHFSTELCGGTHVNATGDIGTFKIIEVTALSAGHRRIVAVTGPRAIELFQDSFNTVKKLSQEFKVQREEVVANVLKQKDQIKNLQTQIKNLKKNLWQSQLPTWATALETIKGIPFLYLNLEQAAPDELKDIAAALDQRTPGLYMLTSATPSGMIYIAHLSPHLSNTFDMKKFGAWLQETQGLRGGGSKNSLQGGATQFNPSLGTAIKQWLAQQ